MANTMEAIEQLIKALNAGYATVTSTGQPAEDLTPAFDTITFNNRPSEKKDDRFPHKCPRCKGPAYIGLNSVDCKNKC